MINQRVETLLQDLSLVSEENYNMVQAVRQLVLGLAENVSEDVKYGGILFSNEKSFCGVFAYAHHISLEFSEGAAMPDAFGVLEGKGKFRRHIKLLEIADVTQKHLAHYVALAYQSS